MRRSVLQARVDAAERRRVISAEAARIKELDREVRDLKEANEILKAASIPSRGRLTRCPAELPQLEGRSHLEPPKYGRFRSPTTLTFTSRGHLAVPFPL
jgi:hypothetical protein